MKSFLKKMSKILPDKLYLSLRYRMILGEWPDLKNPKSFDEKLQWLKLHDHNPDYTFMADKYEAKKYVADKIGDKYIIPTLGVWDSFDEIDFDQLPNQFVLKCTHNSGGLVICSDKSKLDMEKTREIITSSLKENYFWHGREWAYKDIQPRIIAEQYMVDESGIELKDYKIFNFHGIPKIIEVDFNRFVEHKRNIYTTDWEYLDVRIQYPNDRSVRIEKPKCLDELLKLAGKLSEGIPHLRTDFYVINEKIYFGELTFYHGAGFEKFTPKSFGLEMGNWLQIPENSRI